jgi:hypothetical protein
MEALRAQIREGAENQYGALKLVAPYLRSILFSRQRASNNSSFPFGSFVNGTYTGQSDIDVYVQNNSSQYGYESIFPLTLCFQPPIFNYF